MAAPPTYELEIDQGDTEIIEIECHPPGEPETPLDLSGSKLWFRLKSSPGGSTLLTKTSDPGEGISITDVPGGLAEVSITNADTVAMAVEYLERDLPWEIQVRGGAGDITTLARGTLVIHRELVTET